MFSNPSNVISTRSLAPLFQIRHTSLGHILETRGTGERSVPLRAAELSARRAGCWAFTEGGKQQQGDWQIGLDFLAPTYSPSPSYKTQLYLLFHSSAGTPNKFPKRSLHPEMNSTPCFPPGLSSVPIWPFRLTDATPTHRAAPFYKVMVTLQSPKSQSPPLVNKTRSHSGGSHQEAGLWGPRTF